MHRTSTHLLSALFLLATSALAQAPASQTPRSTAPTIQARTNLVILDVVVTDHSGANVHGLQSSDFAITEKGAPQQIRTFEEHTAPTQPIRPEPRPELPAGVFTNYTPAVASAALNVLLLDTLNTPLKDQAFLRLQLLKYLQSAPPGNRIAIFGLATHLIYLQGFTSDPALLRAAIDKKTMRPSEILDNPTSGAPADTLTGTLAASSAMDTHGALAETVARFQQFEADQASFQTQMRVRYTLEGMAQLARYLSTFPGRKNLVWFSGSFPLNIMPDGNLQNPFEAMADMSDQFRDTTNLLTRSEVAVYPVDARGLFTAPMYDASQHGGGDPQTFSRDLMTFNQQTAQEQTTMRQMAEQTGGRAFVNTNGLKEALNTVITTGANFYTITYSPSDTHWDGAYRAIHLNLAGPAAGRRLSLAYRRGYFAEDPGPVKPATRRVLNAKGDAIPAPASPRAMLAAMARGAPEPTEIVFKTRVLPVLAASAPADDAPDPATVASPDPKLPHGPWRRYAIDVAAIPGQLLTTHDPNGDLSGIAELVTHCYDLNGSLVSSTSNAVRIRFSAKDIAQLAGSGIQLHQVISVPTHGEFFLRIGLHDLVSDHIGALEIPVSAVKTLPPLPSPPPSPAHSAPAGPPQ